MYQKIRVTNGTVTDFISGFEASSREFNDTREGLSDFCNINKSIRPATGIDSRHSWSEQSSTKEDDAFFSKVLEQASLSSELCQYATSTYLSADAIDNNRHIDPTQPLLRASSDVPYSSQLCPSLLSSEFSSRAVSHSASFTLTSVKSERKRVKNLLFGKIVDRINEHRECKRLRQLQELRIAESFRGTRDLPQFSEDVLHSGLNQVNSQPNHPETYRSFEVPYTCPFATQREPKSSSKDETLIFHRRQPTSFKTTPSELEKAEVVTPNHGAKCTTNLVRLYSRSDSQSKETTTTEATTPSKCSPLITPLTSQPSDSHQIGFHSYVESVEINPAKRSFSAGPFINGKQPHQMSDVVESESASLRVLSLPKSSASEFSSDKNPSSNCLNNTPWQSKSNSNDSATAKPEIEDCSQNLALQSRLPPPQVFIATPEMYSGMGPFFEPDEVMSDEENQYRSYTPRNTTSELLNILENNNNQRRSSFPENFIKPLRSAWKSILRLSRPPLPPPVNLKSMGINEATGGPRTLEIRYNRGRLCPELMGKQRDVIIKELYHERRLRRRRKLVFWGIRTFEPCNRERPGVRKQEWWEDNSSRRMTGLRLSAQSRSSIGLQRSASIARSLKSWRKFQDPPVCDSPVLETIATMSTTSTTPTLASSIPKHDFVWSKLQVPVDRNERNKYNEIIETSSFSDSDYVSSTETKSRTSSVSSLHSDTSLIVVTSSPLRSPSPEPTHRKLDVIFPSLPDQFFFFNQDRSSSGTDFHNEDDRKSITQTQLPTSSTTTILGRFGQWFGSDPSNIESPLFQIAKTITDSLRTFQKDTTIDIHDPLHISSLEHDPVQWNPNYKDNEWSPRSFSSSQRLSIDIPIEGLIKDPPIQRKQLDIHQNKDLDSSNYF